MFHRLRGLQLGQACCWGGSPAGSLRILNDHSGLQDFSLSQYCLPPTPDKRLHNPQFPLLAGNSTSQEQGCLAPRVHPLLSLTDSLPPHLKNPRITPGSTHPARLTRGNTYSSVLEGRPSEEVLRQLQVHLSARRSCLPLQKWPFSHLLMYAEAINVSKHR